MRGKRIYEPETEDWIRVDTITRYREGGLVITIVTEEEGEEALVSLDMNGLLTLIAKLDKTRETLCR
jgi:hypothetical protein